jgi:hypothetical protein
MASGTASVRRAARSPSRQLFPRLLVVPMSAPCARSPFHCSLRRLLPRALAPSGAVSISPAFAAPVTLLLISPVCAARPTRTHQRPCATAGLLPTTFQPTYLRPRWSSDGVHRREWCGDVVQPMRHPLSALDAVTMSPPPSLSPA